MQEFLDFFRFPKADRNSGNGLDVRVAPWLSGRDRGNGPATTKEKMPMPRTCLACQQRQSITLANQPPLCAGCLDRAGEEIAPGCPVISTVANGWDGMVDSLEDGQIAVVRTRDGSKVRLPIQETVRVQPPY
jgi:hypothetical protein